MTEPAAAALHRLASSVAHGLEMALSRRMLGAVFLLLVAASAFGPWLRPPLSADIRGLQLPLGLLAEGSPAGLLRAPRPIAPVGAGAWLLVLAVSGAFAVLHRPQRLERACGLCLAALLALGQSAGLNHPLLVEGLDHEHEQRQRISRFLIRDDLEAMAKPDNTRVRAPSLLTGQPGDLHHGAAYLVMLPWLTLAAMGAFLLAARGGLRRRLSRLALWLLAGQLVALALCGRRLGAEVLWSRASQLERGGAFAAASRRLHSAVGIHPGLARMERTLLLAGKLDHWRRKSTPEEQLFRARQWANLSRFDQARALAEEQLAAPDSDSMFFEGWLVRLHVDQGVLLTEKRRFSQARNAFERAAELAPGRYDSAFFLGWLDAYVARSEPELVAARFEPILSRARDRPLLADVLATLGDVNFEAGRLSEARRLYERSLRAYSLPKQINYRAQRGLLGM